MMKNFLFYAFFLSVGVYAQQTNEHLRKMDSLLNNNQKDTVSIAVLLYNNVVLQDFAGPMEVFSKAKNLTQGLYRIFTVGLTPGEVYTENKLIKIRPDYSLDDFPHADYVMLPGANISEINRLTKDQQLMDFLKTWNSKENTKTISICTAAYLLAHTGVLNGRRATTHYFVADDFSARYPKVHLVKDVRYVDEVKYLTTSGITSGIDAALYLVGKHSGESIRSMISRALQYNFHEKERWPQAPQGMKYDSRQ
ncbi:DJ-1/PfpI family protein [Elizabethkingia argentiflava]|uniref:DJ-1/PfpI family protein n=1 Tax=Elizabethkingia argenteiflava TaxID=2681556 RepID=A0A845PPM6_9FLAO|nr:DJ-1/PfpI family protein [Elizabethkingia argenteiflava]NAW50279.1 DJ-1/PfpI family protein [Elizabethkingia argenteiflava]